MSDKLFSLKNDYAFKKFFTTSPELLTDFINSILNEWGHTPVTSLTFIDSEEELPRQSIDGKAAYLDIVARDETRAFNLEMQARFKSDFIPRTVFYTFRLYVSGIHKGKKHTEVDQVHSINLLDFTLFQEKIFTLVFFC